MLQITVLLVIVTELIRKLGKKICAIYTATCLKIFTKYAASLLYESFSLKRNYSLVIYLSRKNVAGHVKKKTQRSNFNCICS